MDNNAKIRPLYLAKILHEMTDEEHCLSTPEIISILKEKYNIDGYRTTIASDIELLKAFGLDIETVKSKSNNYHLLSREFDIPEIKLLIDAVASSKFITEKKSNELVAKLGKLASVHQSNTLKRNVMPEGRIKSDNENVYYIIDTINEAINTEKKISFQYFSYNVLKEQKPKHNGEVYIFSPYYLVWNGDYYYMVGFSDKHNEIGSFRVDRIIKAPQIMEDEVISAPDDFNINEYINVNFRMYSGNRETVELICDNSVMDAMIDKFGDELQTFANDMESFRAVVNVSISRVFFSWVFGFEGKVKIKSPDNVRNEYLKMIKKVYEDEVK